jgi:hypothetical protein
MQTVHSQGFFGSAGLANMKVHTALGRMSSKHFWSIVRPYILAILNGYALGRVDVARLSFRILTLTLKVQGADISLFRPIARHERTLCVFVQRP